VFEPREVLEEIVASQARGRPEFHGEGFIVKRSPGQRSPKLPEPPVALPPRIRRRRPAVVARRVTVASFAARLERLCDLLEGAA
jgi:hypothetical protein